MPEVLVLGSTGTTGSRVAAAVAESGATVRLATRHPRDDPRQVRFDWADPSSHRGAVAGADAIYLVAPIGVADPVPQVEPFLRLARDEGVRRVVALGASAVPEADTGMGGIYRLVRTLVPEWAVLRPSWFMQNFLGAHPVALGVRAGEIVSATGDGRVAFIDADDIAAVAARALLDKTAHDTEHLLTGPQALGYGEAAAIITAHTGRTVRHRSITGEELVHRWVERGLDAGFAAVLAALDEDILDEREGHVSDTVARITGRKARSFAEFVARSFG